MTPEQTLQATQLALAACQQQRNAAMDQVINLQVELSLLRAEAAQEKASSPEPEGFNKWPVPQQPAASAQTTEGAAVLPS